MCVKSMAKFEGRLFFFWGGARYDLVRAVPPGPSEEPPMLGGWYKFCPFSSVHGFHAMGTRLRRRGGGGAVHWRPVHTSSLSGRGLLRRRRLHVRTSKNLLSTCQTNSSISAAVINDAPIHRPNWPPMSLINAAVSYSGLSIVTSTCNGRQQTSPRLGAARVSLSIRRQCR